MMACSPNPARRIAGFSAIPSFFSGANEDPWASEPTICLKGRSRTEAQCHLRCGLIISVLDKQVQGLDSIRKRGLLLACCHHCVGVGLLALGYVGQRHLLRHHSRLGDAPDLEIVR